jgi:ABC-type transport system substrate-binding protein
MTLNEYDIAANFWDFTARDDFVFPNEWDIRTAYADDPSGFDALYATMNTTGFPGNAGTFAPHATADPEAHYFAYAGTEANMVKPTEQLIDTVVAKVIPDTNAALIAFESGDLDSFGSSALGANTVADHEDDVRFNVFETFAISGPVLLVMNLLNEHLQKRDVRFSIASMLDKEEMTKINDGFSSPSWSPVWLVYDRFAPNQFIGAGEDGADLSWYTPFVVPYDFSVARNLMLAEGYDVPDEFNFDTTGNVAPIDVVATTLINAITEAGSLGNEWLVGITGFAVMSIAIVRRRRTY